MYEDSEDERLVQLVTDFKLRQEDSKARAFIREGLHNIQYTQSLGYPVWIAVYVKHNKCVGFCTVKVQRKGCKQWGKYATLTYVFVDAKQRGKKIAHKLATAILKETNTNRLKALAASLGGLALFNKLGCEFWGLSEDGKCIIDTGLRPLKDNYTLSLDIGPAQPRYAKYFKGTEKPVPYKEMIKLYTKFQNDKHKK